MKQCPICQNTYPNTIEYFHSRSKRKDLSGYCKKCANQLSTIRISESRRLLKKDAIHLAGGSCVLCGFNKSIWALSFHHLDSSKKDYVISDAKSLEKLKSEMAKCILVCTNCHMEIHDGLHLDILNTGTRVNNYSSKKRKIMKQEYVNYLGGKCIRCGYNKCNRALNFHHRNKDEKEFTFGYMTFFPKVEEVKDELDKCDLLCGNCHYMEHESN